MAVNPGSIAGLPLQAAAQKSQNLQSGLGAFQRGFGQLGSLGLQAGAGRRSQEALGLRQEQNEFDRGLRQFQTEVDLGLPPGSLGAGLAGGEGAPDLGALVTQGRETQRGEKQQDLKAELETRTQDAFSRFAGIGDEKRRQELASEDARFSFLEDVLRERGLNEGAINELLVDLATGGGLTRRQESRSVTGIRGAQEDKVREDLKRGQADEPFRLENQKKLLSKLEQDLATGGLNQERIKTQTAVLKAELERINTDERVSPVGKLVAEVVFRAGIERMDTIGGQLRTIDKVIADLQKESAELASAPQLTGAQGLAEQDLKDAIAELLSRRTTLQDDLAAAPGILALEVKEAATRKAGGTGPLATSTAGIEDLDKALK